MRVPMSACTPWVPLPLAPTSSRLHQHLIKWPLLNAAQCNTASCDVSSAPQVVALETPKHPASGGEQAGAWDHPWVRRRSAKFVFLHCDASGADLL